MDGGGTYLDEVAYLPWMGGTYHGQVCRGRYTSCSFPQEDFLVVNKIAKYVKNTYKSVVI